MNSPDSRIRDHLANDRTLLAWVRTGITLIGLGFVVARFTYFLRALAVEARRPAPAGTGLGAGLGIVIVLVGGLVVGLALMGYLRTRAQIERGSYQSSVAIILVLGGLSVAAAVLLAAYLIAAGRG
ncbi:MAG TPA: DUF202 domain-containing protein [Candidatus Dormibacteraeota bacterium]